MIRMIMIIPKTLNNFFISALSLGELLITRFIIHQVYSYNKLAVHLVYIRIVLSQVAAHNNHAIITAQNQVYWKE